MRVVVLTGAGVSADSGLPTFRDADGLWEGHDPMQVATPEAYAADPDLVHRFYDERRAALAGVEPNPAHRALAGLEQRLGTDFALVTQNVDDLHERAGSTRVLHMHGRLRAARCEECGARQHPWTGTLGDRPACPGCGARALRPDVVWFGEVPEHMAEIESLVAGCDVFAAIGTSGVVYPAAGLVHLARAYGAHTVLLDLEAGARAGEFHQTRSGRASQTVPDWVETVLSDQDRGGGT